MKKIFIEWANAYPLKAWAFPVALGGVGFGALLLCDSLGAAMAYFCAYWVLLCLWIGVVKRDITIMRGLTSTVLVIALLLAPPLTLTTKSSEPPRQPPQEAAAYACGVVVIVVGAVVVYQVVKFCKKAYARQTNSTPEEFTLSASAGGPAAAADVWFCGYCYEPDLTLTAGVVDWSNLRETTIEGTVTGSGSLSITLVTNLGTRTDFLADMAALGLPMQPGRQYALGGRPANQWDVPILFAAERGDVPHVTIAGNDMRTVVVERSFDTVTWTQVVTNTSPANMKIRFMDSSDEPAVIYRARTP